MVTRVTDHNPASISFAQQLTSEISTLVRVALAFVVLPNLPFWIGAHFYDTALRGYLNIEYLLWGVAFFFIPRVLVGVGMSLSLLFDFIRSSARSYYFTQQDLISAYRYLTLLPSRRVVLDGLGLIVISTLWCLFLVRIVAPRNTVRSRCSLPVILLVIALLGVSADVTRGRNGVLRVRDSWSGKKLCSASSITMGRLLIWNTLRHGRTLPSAVDSSTADLLLSLRSGTFSNTGSNGRHNIVVILVESYGILLKGDEAQHLLAPFKSRELAQKYDVSVGEVAFHGATVSGEYRELCGIFASIGTDPRALAPCLPSLLKQHGYETAAFHGYTGAMFDRVHWYPELQFDHTYFEEQFTGDFRFHRCGGALPGVCDSDIAQAIGDRLIASPMRLQFLYWVTLNSHLPVDPSVEVATRYGCRDSFSSNTDEDVCTWKSLIENVNEAIARLALRPGLPSTEFIIVGDHAPPFLLESHRSLFSQSNVPFIHLTPRKQLHTSLR